MRDLKDFFKEKGINDRSPEENKKWETVYSKPIQVKNLVDELSSRRGR